MICACADVCHCMSLCTNIIHTVYTNVYACMTIRDDISTNADPPFQEKAIQVLDLFGEFLFKFASLFRFPNGWVTPKSHENKKAWILIQICKSQQGGSILCLGTRQRKRFPDGESVSKWMEGWDHVWKWMEHGCWR